MLSLDQLRGVQGEGFGLRSIVSDTSGTFGEGFGFSANSFLFVTDANGQRVSGVDFALTWAGGQENIVAYDPAFLYLKTRVVDAEITATFAGSANYQPLTVRFLIPAGGFLRLDLELPFREQYFHLVQKRYF